MILDEIVAWKRKEVAARKAARPLEDLQRAVAVGRARPFEGSLASPGRLSLLAEIKRASPSAGAIRLDVDPPKAAAAMEKAGANALSVLTDEKYFKGSLDDLKAARAAVALPVLEKDFVVDEYQIFEAAAAGADAVLLIVRILGERELEGLYERAKGLGLGVLVEAHTREDLERAARVKPRLVGINNRDLATFKVDVETTLRLLPYVPRGAAVVSQSGIKTAEEAKRLFDAGVSAIQVGESLMRAEDPGGKVRELLRLVGNDRA